MLRRCAACVHACLEGALKKRRRLESKCGINFGRKPAFDTFLCAVVVARWSNLRRSEFCDNSSVEARPKVEFITVGNPPGWKNTHIYSAPASLRDYKQLIHQCKRIKQMRITCKSGFHLHFIFSFLWFVSPRRNVSLSLTAHIEKVPLIWWFILVQLMKSWWLLSVINDGNSAFNFVETL